MYTYICILDMTDRKVDNSDLKEETTLTNVHIGNIKNVTYLTYYAQAVTPARKPVLCYYPNRRKIADS